MHERILVTEREFQLNYIYISLQRFTARHGSHGITTYFDTTG
jgi:hypothetical protein